MTVQQLRGRGVREQCAGKRRQGRRFQAQGRLHRAGAPPARRAPHTAPHAALLKSCITTRGGRGPSPTWSAAERPATTQDASPRGAWRSWSVRWRAGGLPQAATAQCAQGKWCTRRARPRSPCSRGGQNGQALPQNIVGKNLQRINQGRISSRCRHIIEEERITHSPHTLPFPREWSGAPVTTSLFPRTLSLNFSHRQPGQLSNAL